MKQHEHFHCDSCGVAFMSRDALEKHDQSVHVDQADGAEGPAREAASQPRKDREFTRSHRE